MRIDVTETGFKLALTMFYVREKKDFSSFKLTKLKFNKKHGWHRDGEVKINEFAPLAVGRISSHNQLSMLDFAEVTKSRVSLSDLNFQNLGAIAQKR